MKFYYPGGKHKALTFSYDDGQIFDIRLAELFRSRGMKGTFNLNSSTLADCDNAFFVNKNKLNEIYKDHEIAIHGVEHKNLCHMTEQEIALELLPDRQALEKLTGRIINGMAYAFGAYNDDVIRIAKSLGVHYSRTVGEDRNFELPTEFLKWNSTCHHNNDLMNLGKMFLDWPLWRELPLMYVWGHSYEFGNCEENWKLIEDFTEMMQGKDDIWYATNGEIYDYVTAMRRLEFSANRDMVFNPSTIDVWYRGKNEEPLVIKAGETKCLV